MDSRYSPSVQKSYAPPCAASPHIHSDALPRNAESGRDTQTCNHHAKAVENRYADAAQSLFLFFIIFTVALLTNRSRRQAALPYW